MLISQPLPFVKAFVEAIDEAIRAHQPFSPGLSTIQRRWLGLCLMGVLVTNSVCWARFERASLGRYSALSLILDVPSRQAALGVALAEECSGGPEKPRDYLGKLGGGRRG